MAVTLQSIYVLSIKIESMKRNYFKVLTTALLFFVCAVTTTATAAVVYDFVANPWNLPVSVDNEDQSGHVTAPIVQDNVSLSVTDGSTPTRLYQDYTTKEIALRAYGGAVLTLTATDGKNLSQVVFETANDKGAFTVTTGTQTGMTWTGNASTVEFAVSSSVRLSKITVTFEGESGGSEPTPPVSDALFEETFANGQGAFTIDDASLGDGLTYVWKADTKYGYMKASAYANKTNIASESWLVSPEFDLTSETDATLSFEHVGNFFTGDMATMATVWARVAGGEWSQLAVSAYPEADGWSPWVEATASLSAFVGHKAQIAFKYVSTDDKAGTWEVKNVKVSRGTSTGIQTPVVRPESKGKIYSLDGRVVTRPTKGIYIVDGKKVIFK